MVLVCYKLLNWGFLCLILLYCVSIGHLLCHSSIKTYNMDADLLWSVIAEDNASTSGAL